MKKSYLIMAAIASLALVSCSDEEFVGNPELGPGQGKTAEIVFGSVGKGMTRADLTGEAAADLLNKKFVFHGTKTTTSSSIVFDHYYANWVENTANTTESNSNDWEYVGYTPATTTSLPDGATQSIKYWDYAANQYDFAAYSLGKGVTTTGANPTTSYAVASKIDFDNLGSENSVYTLTGTADQLKACYISDLVTAYNKKEAAANQGDPDIVGNDFGNVVTFKFRALAAKIRLAFYETIPGYSVKSVQFYNKTGWDAAQSKYVYGNETADNTPYLLTSTDATTLPTGSGTMTITFPTTGWANSPKKANATDYNKAHVSFANTSAEDLSSKIEFGGLANFATAREGVLDPSGNYIGRASNDATYADGDNPQGTYYTILPNETGTNLMIRIKYTLVSTDGSGEEITVDNATAVIPAELAKWSPNYAYTYIFKISDMTNGSTGFDGNGDVVGGLTPITLNAVVVDSEDGIQETITTVSDPSITTYMAGKVVTEYDEYKRIVIENSDPTAYRPIYLIVNDGTQNITLTAANAKLYTATVETGALQGITEETVDNALRYGVITTSGDPSVTTYTVNDAADADLVVTDVTSQLSLVSNIDAADSPTGNQIDIDGTNNKVAKFTPEAGKIYAFQYLKEAGTANNLTAVPVKTLTQGATYYTKSGNTYTEMTATGNEKVIKGGTEYYTLAVTYEPVQAATLTVGNKYYTSATGQGEFTYEENGPQDPKVTPYYEKKETYTIVPFATLTAGTTYYTSERGAGAFEAAGSESVDAEGKYYSGTLGTPAKYQYKIIKVASGS
jgi:hypothetical protein